MKIPSHKKRKLGVGGGGGGGGGLRTGNIYVEDMADSQRCKIVTDKQMDRSKKI